MSDSRIKDIYLPTWLNHVKVLAEEIGPRGSTTEKEKDASDYCHQVLQELQLSPIMETFTSAKSIYHPHLIVATVMLLAFAIYPLYGPLSAAIAALISIFTFASQMFELSLRDNLLRRLVPKGTSQNVIAVMDPEGEHKRDLVLIGHVDSARTPVIFRSPTWLKVYQAFVAITLVLGLSQIILYSIGTFTQWSWIWPVTISSALSSATLAALCIHADKTPFSPGANDNATAAGLVLTLAQHMQNEPLQATRVWLVCSGCEEVLLYGAVEFFRRHTPELKNPVALVFEMLGCAGPSWLTQEGIIIPFKSDPALVQLAEQVAEANPHLVVYPSRINGGVSETAAALRAGIPAITLGGMSPQGEMPYWHQVEDTYDKMDPEVMSQMYEYAWEYIGAIDIKLI